VGGQSAEGSSWFSATLKPSGIESDRGCLSSGIVFTRFMSYVAAIRTRVKTVICAHLLIGMIMGLILHNTR